MLIEHIYFLCRNCTKYGEIKLWLVVPLNTNYTLLCNNTLNSSVQLTEIHNQNYWDDDIKSDIVCVHHNDCCFNCSHSVNVVNVVICNYSHNHTNRHSTSESINFFEKKIKFELRSLPSFPFCRWITLMNFSSQIVVVIR